MFDLTAFFCDFPHIRTLIFDWESSWYRTGVVGGLHGWRDLNIWDFQNSPNFVCRSSFKLSRCLDPIDPSLVITHPLYLSQSINVQSGLHVAIKWGRGTAERVFITRLMATFQVKPKKNLQMKETWVASSCVMSSLFRLNSREKCAGCAEGSNLNPGTGGQI